MLRLKPQLNPQLKPQLRILSLIVPLMRMRLYLGLMLPNYKRLVKAQRHKRLKSARLKRPSKFLRG